VLVGEMFTHLTSTFFIWTSPLWMFKRSVINKVYPARAIVGGVVLLKHKSQ